MGAPSRAQAKQRPPADSNSAFYVGVDVSKTRHAIAIVEEGRQEELCYFGEIEATAMAVEGFAHTLEKKQSQVHFC